MKASIVIDALITTSEMFFAHQPVYLVDQQSIFLECHGVLDQHKDGSSGQEGHKHPLTYHGLLLCYPARVPDFATELIVISQTRL